jgi:hypothetical protein
VFARCGKFLVVLSLVLTTGLHWAALQTVAWTAMFASHLRSGSLSQAVDNTFDGRHPCCLCKAIAAAKKSQKNSEAVSLLLKMEFPPVAQAVTLIPPAEFELIRPQNFFARSISLRPPIPPPKHFFA